MVQYPDRKKVGTDTYGRAREKGQQDVLRMNERAGSGGTAESSAVRVQTDAWEAAK